jgi:thiamine biosynthesis lipoprotein
LSTLLRAKSHRFLFLLSLFVLSQCRVGKTWHSETLFFFDTVCDIQVWCRPSEAAPAQEEVRRIFTEIEALYSPGSQDLSSPAVLELYQKAKQVHDDSEGCFDIAVGALSDLWGFSSKSYQIPRPEDIAAALKFVGMDKIEVHEAVLFPAPGIKLDWGSIAKGWAVDHAAKSLQAKGYARGFINAGGDLYCWGKNPAGTAWRIGIQHPRRQGYLGVLSLSDIGVATSGDYQRYFEQGGIRYHHIFDPKTGYPARGKRSVTIIGPETTLCDALSTALFVSPRPQSILKKYPAYGVIIVDEEGNITLEGRRFPLDID